MDKFTLKIMKHMYKVTIHHLISKTKTSIVMIFMLYCQYKKGAGLFLFGVKMICFGNQLDFIMLLCHKFAVEFPL